MSRKTCIKPMSMDRSWLCQFHHRMDMRSVDGMTMPVIQEQPYTKIGAAEYGDKTCYGYFKDVQKPKLAASVESNVSPNTKGWYNTDQIRIVLSYSDNKGVADLYGKVDDGGYEEIPGVITEGEQP